HSRDVGLEADPEANERLAEQLALLTLLERLVELFVREQSLAQQERAELRAGLVVEELVVEACRPHRKEVSGFSTPNLREKRNPTFWHGLVTISCGWLPPATRRPSGMRGRAPRPGCRSGPPPCGGCRTRGAARGRYRRRGRD